MDTILKNGSHSALYRTNSATLGTPYAKGVSAFTACEILSYSEGSNYGYQIAFFSGAIPMMRLLKNGTITDWDTGFLPLTGGTLTGSLQVANGLYVTRTINDILYKSVVSPSGYTINSEGASALAHYIAGVVKAYLMVNAHGVAFRDCVNNKQYNLFGEHNKVPVANGGTGGNNRASGIYNLLFIGANPITSTSNDTTANWIVKGNGYCFYSTANMITNQPSTYGILINYVYGSECSQLWHSQPTGPLYIRGGNADGWNHSWRKIFDNSQTIPVANGGTGAKTFASGAALIGNGTGAVTTRAITNNTSVANASGTNIPTCNTVNYHVRDWLNRDTQVDAADTGYAAYRARGIALVTAAPSSLTNGCCAFVYQ